MIDKVTALYDKSCVCRHCQATFSTKRIRSGALTMIHRDSDFYTTFKEQSLNPILYTVNVCPVCGFAFTDQFTSKLAPWQKQIVEEHISSKWKTKNFGSIRKVPEAIVSYKLAIYAAELTNQPHSVKAGLYLRLAWLYRSQANLAQELRFIAIAVEEYEESYIHSDYRRGDKEMTEVKLLYLIGELYRRLQKFDLAIKYFGKALSFRNHTIESGIIRMAHDQWQLTREEFKEKKSEQKIG
ncbi:DUF2225 domain-containing protein [Brevibacillus gelatini]|uniref:DUF2225 domain-containing protein n=1 Tax=Brevibacillus gelatini TaxID=1655277 RepID=A0A3M8B1V6_9BACL|nr:DUF2225 domain-containing protein [Brevibacillus gelatini]RNB56977.1 DUF2225 domain-containing protein [Brevibacillus gelatini]